MDMLTSSLNILGLTDTCLDVDEQRYERDRSASPRPARRGDSPRGGVRTRSASPNGRMDTRYDPLFPYSLTTIPSCCFYDSSND